MNFLLHLPPVVFVCKRVCVYARSLVSSSRSNFVMMSYGTRDLGAALMNIRQYIQQGSRKQKRNRFVSIIIWFRKDPQNYWQLKYAYLAKKIMGWNCELMNLRVSQINSRVSCWFLPDTWPWIDLTSRAHNIHTHLHTHKGLDGMERESTKWAKQYNNPKANMPLLKR